MSAAEDDRLFIGVDVGTGSARAALFTTDGQRLNAKKHEKNIKKWTNSGFPDGSYEQSTEDIWRAVCSAVKDACDEGGYSDRVVGIGFAATCSLAVVDSHGKPVTVSPTKDPNRNVILWQDHRAKQEAIEINSLHHPVLRYVGGALSPEMQPPKLLWLKKHLRQGCWERAGYFFDLADYLTYRATGVCSRSLCCVVCKWTYIEHISEEDKKEGLNSGWNDTFWQGAGLGDIVADGYNKIGVDIAAPGKPVGNGLTQISANEMGLCPGIAVATSLIDAHAGGVGMLGANLDEGLSSHVTTRLALIGGTSTCHMALSDSTAPNYVPGVWGPYYSAMIPGYYLNEGGQSTTGQLLDYILQSNDSIYKLLKERASLNHNSVNEELQQILLSTSHHLPHYSHLTTNLHIIPDYHGNRSPLADPAILGMISGLSMIDTVDDLSTLYLAVIQALAFGTRHIIEAMNTHGHDVQVMLICGGLRLNNLYIKAHADITGIPVVILQEEESVLLGAAILASAAVHCMEVADTMKKMTITSGIEIVKPNTDPIVKSYYDKKYKVFLEMYRDQRKYASIMTFS